MNNLSVFSSALKTFDKFYIGVDHLVKIQEDLTKNTTSYPFYNIKKTGDSKYQIDLALAGWSKSELELELDKDKLIIRGNVTEDDSDEYFFKGISKRAFTRSFMLNDTVVVNGSEFTNGLLSIFLERLVPEDKKPRKIEIGEKTSQRQLLTED